jgi:hypothetical protein
MESIWNLWNPYAIPWNPYGMTLAEAPAIFSFHRHYGIHMEWTWNDAFHMDSISIPYGLFHMESISIPYGFHMDSIWTVPYGIHGMIVSHH